MDKGRARGIENKFHKHDKRFGVNENKFVSLRKQNERDEKHYTRIRARLRRLINGN